MISYPKALAGKWYPGKSFLCFSVLLRFNLLFLFGLMARHAFLWERLRGRISLIIISQLTTFPASHFQMIQHVAWRCWLLYDGGSLPPSCIFDSFAGFSSRSRAEEVYQDYFLPLFNGWRRDQPGKPCRKERRWPAEVRSRCGCWRKFVGFTAREMVIYIEIKRKTQRNVVNKLFWLVLKLMYVTMTKFNSVLTDR